MHSVLTLVCVSISGVLCLIDFERLKIFIRPTIFQVHLNTTSSHNLYALICYGSSRNSRGQLLVYQNNFRFHTVLCRPANSKMMAVTGIIRRHISGNDVRLSDGLNCGTSFEIEQWVYLS